MWKRLLCTAILAHASCGVWAASGDAASYPNKPIRMVLGFPPGGALDFQARVVGPKLTERFGQPVIVDNRPGAGGNLAAEITARANPDGYTLMFGTSTNLASAPSLYAKLGYDLMKDLAYISRVSTGSQVLLAHPSMPAKSVPELVALARSKPKVIQYGSGGVGSGGQLAMELLISRASIELLHVPYKGAGPAVIALVGGQVQLLYASVTSAIPMIQAKRVNALAVSGAKRNVALPGVPTVAEAGFPGYDVTDTFGILAPAGMPAAVVKLLNAEIRKIVQMDDVTAKLAELALEAAGSTPDEFRAVVRAEASQWARVIKEAKIPAM